MTNLFMFNDKNTLLIGDLKEQHFFLTRPNEEHFFFKNKFNISKCSPF